MRILFGTLFNMALLLSGPIWAAEPIICEIGDYVQYRQELAREAIKVKDGAKTQATKVDVAQEDEKAVSSDEESPLHAATWGPPWGGFRKKLEGTCAVGEGCRGYAGTCPETGETGDQCPHKGGTWGPPWGGFRKGLELYV